MAAHLGTGLQALMSYSSQRENQLERQEEQLSQAPHTPEPAAVPAPASIPDDGGDNRYRVIELLADDLVPSPYQPRKSFDDEGIEDLAASIREHGLLQPLLVRLNADGKYEIVGGERRYRACKLAEINPIPCIVTDVLEQDAYAIALIENIQREDLNPLEQAQAMEIMIKECALTQEDLARTLGKSRSSIANLLRINSLDDEVKTLVASGDIDLGHAKVILGVPSGQQGEVARQVIADDLNVRDTEALVRSLNEDKKDRPAKPRRSQPRLYDLEKQLKNRFGFSKIKLIANQNHRGMLTLSFKSEAEMNTILEALGVDSEARPAPRRRQARTTAEPEGGAPGADAAPADTEAAED